MEGIRIGFANLDQRIINDFMMDNYNGDYDKLTKRDKTKLLRLLKERVNENMTMTSMENSVKSVRNIVEMNIRTREQFMKYQ